MLAKSCTPSTKDGTPSTSFLGRKCGTPGVLFKWALVLLVLAAAPSARAAELWTSANGDSTYELSGFYKTFGTYLHLPGSLVEGVDALQALEAKAAAALPASEAAKLIGPSLPHDALESTHIFRVWTTLALANAIQFDAAYEFAASAAPPALIGGVAALGNATPGVQTAIAPGRRLVDVNGTVYDQGSFLAQQNLDRLSVKFKLPRGEIVAGRQVLSWGAGHFWNPTDLLTPFAPTQVDKEVRPGTDALRCTVPLSSTALVDALWLPQQRGPDQGGVLRAQANAGGFDFSASAAKYLADVVFGADTIGDAGPINVHAEAAYTLGLSGLSQNQPVGIGERFLRAVAGLEAMPNSDWTLDGEYYFNGFGATSPAGYFAKLRSPRETNGEVFGAGQEYAGVGVIWKTTSLLTLNATVIANLQDPSAIALPVAEYSVANNVTLRAGGYVPIGRHPDPRPLQALTTVDLLTQSAAFKRAASTLGVRSEYGVSPAGAFVELAAYF